MKNSMKNFINSDHKLAIWFRKSFLEKLLRRVEKRKKKSIYNTYCCSIWSWHKCFICWKELNEVQSNFGSSYLRDYLMNQPTRLTCGVVWFYSNTERAEFLKECLAKFENKN